MIVGVLALAMASAAYATKPGSGSATGRASVFAPNPVQDLGFMYNRHIEDPDGYVWEMVWMNPSANA